MNLTARNLDQMTFLGKAAVFMGSVCCLFSGMAFSRVIPLEPFSPASDVPLSGALVSSRSGILASSAPNPGAQYSLEAIEGQAMLFEIAATGLGQLRVRIEDPDGVILHEDSLGEEDSQRWQLIAGKSGRYLVRLHPLTVEEALYDFSASLVLILDEDGNDSLVNAQLLDQGFIPTGVHDRAITLRSESSEASEFFQIDLGAGETLSLAAEARRIEIQLLNSLGESLAVSSPDVSGLSALVDGFSSTSNQSIFVEVSNPRAGAYDLVATISSPAEELVPPSEGRLVFDQLRPFSNVQQANISGTLLNAEGFKCDVYRLTFEKHQAVSLIMSSASVGPFSYLLESPGRVPLRVGVVDDLSKLSLTTAEAGDYFLTLSTVSGELVPYTVEVSRNVLIEPSASNERESEAYSVGYGWVKIGGCSRLLTVSGQVGLGADQFDLEPNNTLEEAQNIDLGEWSLEFSSDIQSSTTIPHTSMRGGGGEGTKDIYRFTSQVPNSRLICDIDRSFSLNSFLRLLDSEGNLVVENDNSETDQGGGGSGTQNDSFIDIVLAEGGTYYLEVGRNGGDGALGNNDRYELHLSLENHPQQSVPGSDPHDYYQIDLVAGEVLTLGCYQDDPFLEVFEIGNPLWLDFFSRFDLPQLITYRAVADTSLIVKVSNELVLPYDLLVLLNVGLEEPFHSAPATSMNVDAGEPTLAWLVDGLSDFYRVSFSNDDARSVSISQLDQGTAKSSLGIAVYNSNEELVMESLPSVTNQVSVSVPLELGDEFYVAVTNSEESPALYLLQVGDAASECREVLPAGSFAVDWQVVPNQSYQVEFSSNLLDWTRIPENVSSPTSILLWLDDGPPRTDSAPGFNQDRRFYRLMTPAQ